MTDSPQFAERAVLGGMMLSRRVIWEVLDELEPTDFADARHEVIFRAIATLAHGNRPTDVLAVGDQLGRDGDLQRIGGAPQLHEMIGEVPTAANATYYAGMVKQAAIRRRLIEASTRIVQTAQATEGDAFAIAEQARAEIDAAASTARTELAPVGDSLEAVVESLRESPRFIPTPWPHLNGIINGLRPGALYVIGARPGSGKTIMGLQLATCLAERGAVSFSSLEMDTADLTKRLFASMGGIHMSSITRSELRPSEWEMIARLRPQIRQMPLFIDDRAGVTINQIKAHSRSVTRRGVLVGIVVDYLQLIRSGDPRKPRWEAVGEISAALKVMARELQVPVVALCQLNRESESRGAGGRRLPGLADLRESGSIEQDADVVMLLQRGEDPDSGEPSDELDVVIAKNRHGQTGKITLLWEGHFARVSPLPW